MRRTNRPTFLRGTALAGTATAAGCTGGDDGTAPESTPVETLSDGEVVELTGSPCEAIAGATFESIEKHDAGMGPGTAALTHSDCDDQLPLAGAGSRVWDAETPGSPGWVENNRPNHYHWTIRFERGGYEYSHSDVVESGRYSCTVEDGAASLGGSHGDSGPTYSGTYDPESGVLEWDGVRFRPVEWARVRRQSRRSRNLPGTVPSPGRRSP